MAADDPLSAALEEIRERQAKTLDGFSSDVTAYIESQADVPRLLAALDKVLKRHERLPVYGLSADEQFPDRCPHGPDYDGDAHFEDDSDGEWLCISLPAGAVCASCIDADGMREGWPCPTVEDITRALLGEAAGG